MSEAQRLTVTLVKSVIGYPRDQRATVRSLGLHRLGRRVEVTDNQVMRGMLHKVNHLVRVETAAVAASAPRRAPARARPVAMPEAKAPAAEPEAAAPEAKAPAEETEAAAPADA